MAIDVCSEISSPGISPRISFSYDLNQRNPVPIEDHRLDSSLLDSSSDFNFCIVNNLKLELSSADELFSNGKIIPSQIKKNNSNASKNTHQQNEPPVQHPSTENTEKKKRLKEFLSTSFDAEEQEEDEKPASKSFWQFRRSSSLNFDTSRGKSLIKSLQFLSRSNSTGSAPSSKQTKAIPKETQKPNLQKQQSVSSRRSSASSCSSNYYPNNYSAQKPCLRKSGSYGNGVRISPVLNLPPPYISKVTISFFGFGSLFCSGKDKKKKK